MKILLGILALLTILTISFISNPSDKCFIREYKNQICKPITKELRPEYFKISLNSIKDNLLWGYGPGTYSLITDKYSVSGNFSSIFAHNFFLQLIAESGVISGIFIFFFIFILAKKAIKIVAENNRKKLEFYLAISFILLFVNSLFDYDWNVFYTFQLALLIASAFVSKSKNILNQKIASIIWYILALIVIVIGSFTILTKLILSDGQVNLIVNTYPYLYEDSKQIIYSKEITQININKMLEIYRYDSNIISHSISLINNDDEKISAYQKLVITSPWTATNKEFLKLLYENNQFKELGEVSTVGLKLVEEASKKGYVVRYQVKENLAFYLHESANYHLSNGDVNLAAKYYEEVLLVEEWAFHIYEPFYIVYENTSLEDIGMFFDQIDMKPIKFGKRESTFSSFFLNKLFSEISSIKPQNILVFKDYFGEGEYWAIVSNMFYEKIKYQPSSAQMTYYDWWYDFWLLYISSVDPKLMDREDQFILMNTLYRFEEYEKANTIQKYLYSDVLPFKK